MDVHRKLLLDIGISHTDIDNLAYYAGLLRKLWQMNPNGCVGAEDYIVRRIKELISAYGDQFGICVGGLFEGDSTALYVTFNGVAFTIPYAEAGQAMARYVEQNMRKPEKPRSIDHLRQKENRAQRRARRFGK